MAWPSACRSASASLSYGQLEVSRPESESPAAGRVTVTDSDWDGGTVTCWDSLGNWESSEAPDQADSGLMALASPSRTLRLAETGFRPSGRPAAMDNMVFSMRIV